MDSERMRASMKAIDDLLELLDTRDVEDAKRLKEHGVVPAKGSEPDLDEDKLGDKEEEEEVAEGDGKHDELKASLREMSGHSEHAKNALDMLSDDDDDEDEDDAYC